MGGEHSLLRDGDCLRSVAAGVPRSFTGKGWGLHVPVVRSSIFGMIGLVAGAQKCCQNLRSRLSFP